MICNSCRRALYARSKLHVQSLYHKPSHRSVATVPSSANAAQSFGPPSTIPDQAPPAISSKKPGASHPFSTPLSPQSPTNIERGQGAVSTTVAQPTPVIRGSLPGGAELQGLGYLKATPKVYAKEDDEYPTWLWGLLDGGKVGEKKIDLAGEFDLQLEQPLKSCGSLTRVRSSDDKETTSKIR